ncbi:hypothetical protein [Streptomyces sp. TLI_053]|uniref:hypothetical protein n=1 Tax=Streptomyces sp. TLI_053 TaxID=1855352 RepID=UPI001E59B038|nr:hypothetical protein [Streptomyces sp. TLI_053]
MELDDPGFHHSVLSGLRDRLTEGDHADRLLDLALAHLKEASLVRERTTPRTDSTHVLAAVRDLTRLELFTEAVRAAMEEVAGIAPHLLDNLADENWGRYYGRPVRLGKNPNKPRTRTLTTGNHAAQLLEHLHRHGGEHAGLPANHGHPGRWQRLGRGDDGLSATRRSTRPGAGPGESGGSAVEGGTSGRAGMAGEDEPGTVQRARRTMRWLMTMLINQRIISSELSVRVSQSRARQREHISHANDRSTSHLLGKILDAAASRRPDVAQAWMPIHTEGIEQWFRGTVGEAGSALG